MPILQLQTYVSKSMLNILLTFLQLFVDFISMDSHFVLATSDVLGQQIVF